MITIDYRDRKPIYLQIIDNVETLAAKGILPADSQLPTVRNLAVELAINPNTIQRAYGELEKRGIIYTIPGRGSFIAKTPQELMDKKIHLFYEELKNKIQDARSMNIPLEDILARCREYFDLGPIKEGETI